MLCVLDNFMSCRTLLKLLFFHNFSFILFNSVALPLSLSTNTHVFVSLFLSLVILLLTNTIVHYWLMIRVNKKYALYFCVLAKACTSIISWPFMDRNQIISVYQNQLHLKRLIASMALVRFKRCAHRL